MKTLITLFTVSVFIIILIKSKLGRLGIKTSRNKKPAALETETQTQTLSSADNADNGLLDGYYRHDVYVFDYDKCDSETYFAGLIDARLSIIEAEMREQGRQYRLKYIVLGNALVVIIEYRMKTASVSLPEVKA